jgi:allophanate hydrolase subunit 1
MEKLSNPEVPQHLLAASEMIVRYASGQISYEEYREKLNAWWEKNKEAWQENDLLPLFLLCLAN